MNNSLIVFATYWNEIDWIDASLEQINAIDPIEVIICDGCFDLSRPVYSDDGTRERIKEYVRNRPNARLISPVRLNRLGGFIKTFRGHSKMTNAQFFSPSRTKSLIAALLFNTYRINQALTFQKMISLSKYWSTNKWFMTLDADQYYSDALIEKFHMIDSFARVDVLCAQELTFFDNFEFYTDSYEGRGFNNMPHRIMSRTNIIPTRDIIFEKFSYSSFFSGNFMKSDRYVSRLRSAHIGHYNHYKFKRSLFRESEGYKLGDRVAPNSGLYEMKKYEDAHPSVVARLMYK